ncbi:MAG TPA: acetolactate synthase small subunit [Candidatus Nanoarchaeia archaeon]|nr:acetolactate synthase small subunit [Candidatus Nanoarchaeia archaeon]
MRHTICILVNDEPGVMTRIAGLFARRGYNIETITVGKTHSPGTAKIVITVFGDDQTIEQIEKQVGKLIDTQKVYELKPDESVIRELCLVKVNVSGNKKKDEVIKYANVYKNKIVDITPKTVTLEIIGEPQKIDTFLELVKPYGILDMSRTGITGILRESPKQ